MKLQELRDKISQEGRVILDYLIATGKIKTRNEEIEDRIAKAFIEKLKNGLLKKYLPRAKEYALSQYGRRDEILEIASELTISVEEAKKLKKWKFLEFWYRDEEGKWKNSASIKEEVINWLKRERKKKPFLIMHGKPGTGKTTLAMKIAVEYMKRGKSVEFLNVRKFNKIIYDFQSIVDYLEDQVRGATLMVIDDVTTFLSSKHRLEFLFAIVDTRYTLRRETIITTNVNLLEEEREMELKLIADRLKEAGKFIHFDYPSLRDPETMKQAKEGKIETRKKASLDLE